MQVFNFYPPVPAPGLPVAAAPHAGPPALAQPWQLPASLENYVQWADPQKTIGNIPACYLLDNPPFADAQVVKTIDGAWVVGQVDASGQRLAACGPGGGVFALFPLRAPGFGGPALWHPVSSPAGWTEAVFNAERDRFLIYARDVGLREHELHDACAVAARMHRSGDSPLANQSPEAIESAWTTVAKKWDPLTQPVLRDAIGMLARQAQAAGAPATQMEALHGLAATFEVGSPLETSLRDVIARDRSSQDWWRAASETESDSVKRLDAHCSQRRQVDADLAALLKRILLNRAALGDALGPRAAIDPDALCQLLAGEWRGEARLVRLGGFVPTEAALLPSLKKNLETVFERLSSLGALPAPDFARAAAEIATRLSGPQMFNTLGRLGDGVQNSKIDFRQILKSSGYEQGCDNKSCFEHHP